MRSIQVAATAAMPTLMRRLGQSPAFSIATSTIETARAQ